MKTRRWIWHALLALALLGAGWWWLARVPEPRLITRIQVATPEQPADCTIQANDSGFLLHIDSSEHGQRCESFDWQGKSRWCIPVRAGGRDDLHSRRFPVHSIDQVIALSDDGHYALGAGFVFADCNYYLLKDGKPVTRLSTKTLPGQTAYRVDDNGTVLIANCSLTGLLTLCRFDRTQPCETVQCPLPKTSQDISHIHSITFTPRGDGLVCWPRGENYHMSVHSFDYFTISDHPFALTHRYHSSLHFGNPFHGVCEDGAVITDGHYTTPAGVSTPLPAGYRYDGLPAYGRYVVMLQEASNVMTAVGCGAPGAPPRWITRLDGLGATGTASADGQVVCLSYYAPLSRMIEKMQQFPWIGDWYSQLPEREYIAFYANPGKLRARLKTYRDPGFTYLLLGKEKYQILDSKMSPDGHRLAVLADGPRGLECLVYGW